MLPRELWFLQRDRYSCWDQQTTLPSAVSSSQQLSAEYTQNTQRQQLSAENTTISCHQQSADNSSQQRLSCQLSRNICYQHSTVAKRPFDSQLYLQITVQTLLCDHPDERLGVAGLVSHRHHRLAGDPVLRHVYK